MHKKNLLEASYNKVVATTDGSEEAQDILNNFIKANTRNYPDLIADMSLMIQDDLCIVRSYGDQELIAASICSPSYWNVQSKIGKSLHNIHGPVLTLNEKIGERISKFIRQSPVMKPFKRQNWLIHGDTDRFHLREEGGLNSNPETWFIRSEKETLCRFHEKYSLFTINLMFQPLKAIFKFPKARNDLIESIKTFDDDEIEFEGNDIELSTERYSELAASEEVILTVASNGQGKRSSAYEYRTTNRGGKGVIAIKMTKDHGDLVAPDLP